VVAFGATGGVGSLFVQIAARAGAKVVAVCSAGNADYARGLGAADVIDYTQGDVATAVRARHPDGIDAVAGMYTDTGALALLAEQVRSGGRVASAVGGVDVDALATRGVAGTNVQGRVTTESLDRLAGLIESKEVVVPPVRSYSLAEAAEALAAVATGHTRGKIVITPA
jgi:NADPH:quinone reductase-like Zn-dependent oxidoreductase